jgi:hypothetical protein
MAKAKAKAKKGKRKVADLNAGARSTKVKGGWALYGGAAIAKRTNASPMDPLINTAG